MCKNCKSFWYVLLVTLGNKIDPLMHPIKNCRKHPNILGVRKCFKYPSELPFGSIGNHVTPKELKDLDLTTVLHQVDVPVKQWLIFIHCLIIWKNWEKKRHEKVIGLLVCN